MLSASTVTITGAEHHYLFRVRRLRPGDGVVLCDGTGTTARFRVADISSNSASLQRDGEAITNPHGDTEIVVMLPLIKGDRMDRCITQLVELGVDGIIPYRAERAVVTLDGDRGTTRRDRYQKLAESASRQCARSILPTIFPLCSLEEALQQTGQADVKLMLFEGSRNQPLLQHMPAEAPTTVAVLSGPEGGFSEREVDQARGADYRPVGLGPLTLRADTAPVAAVAILADHVRHRTP
jgi:16S rRNA (uracil1498-N3)-methyltransferase